MEKHPDIRPFKGVMPEIADSAYIDPATTIIGDVVIEEQSSIWPGTVIRGDVNFIRIGKRTNIQDGSILHVTGGREGLLDGFPLVIGDNVTVGHNVILHGCTLQDTCFIGMGATVMDGSVIEEHAMVGAGALVPEGTVVESGYLYVGLPAKKRRLLTPEELAWLDRSAQNYVNYALEYLS